MALALIPPIGTAGVYTLAAPFTTQLQAQTSYKCDAIRRFADLIEVGIEPFEEYYQPLGLTQAQYQVDLANNVCMVSLVSNTGHWVYVPSSFIQSYPDIGGVPYVVTVLGLELGALPTYMDLTGLKVALAQLCRDTIGKQPDVKEAVISAVEKLSQSDHDTLENARVLAINNSQTDRARYLAAQAELATLRQQYTALEAWVKQNVQP